ncbi:MAG: class IV adenylate cyclase [Thermodesulfobacteriota bacterium]
MPLIEIEVKFYIQNYEEIIKKVAKYAGNPFKKGFEQNILFDTKDFSFRKKNKILRLRSYNNLTILTIKTPPDKKDPDFKTLKETECIVDSHENMRFVLNECGFINEQIYEKQREIFQTDKLEICIDRLPFGDFIELEGDRDKIRQAASFFNFNWENRILPSYRAIFEKIKQDYNLSFTDITFKNFKGLKEKNFHKSITSL